MVLMKPVESFRGAALTMQSTLSPGSPAKQQEQSGCGGNSRWPERGSAVNYFLFFLFFLSAGSDRVAMETQ